MKSLAKELEVPVNVELVNAQAVKVGIVLLYEYSHLGYNCVESDHVTHERSERPGA